MKMEIVFKGDLGAYLQGKAERIIGALRVQVAAETSSLLSYIKDEKLDGQVLNQRSSHLRNSGYFKTSETDTEIQGSVAFGSGRDGKSTVPYAKIQNYGGTIPEVNDKLMVFMAAEGDYSPWGGAFAQGNKLLVFTRHHKAFTLPARNYMESSLEEREAQIRANLQEAVNKAAAE